KVVAKIVEQGKAKKVLVFKKKRRKGYRVLRGHRQLFTALSIQEIM
ncbi:bL21 family ribosomal protein, partial [Desulfobulbus sp. US2]|nr:bL21 family ribosomal protein [Desulfobulbus sp. US2]